MQPASVQAAPARTAPVEAIVQGLRPAQLRAVTHEGRALVVLAGPGTGKTRVIVHRVAHLIRERGVEPQRVLACTFSVRAAQQLRARLAGRASGDFEGSLPLIAPQQALRVRAQTLHALGAWIVRRFADRLGLPARLVMADPAQRRRLTKSIIKRHGLFPHALGEGLDALAARVERASDVLGERGVLPGRALAFASAQRGATGEDFASAFRASPEDDARVLGARLDEFEHLARAYEACGKEMRTRGWLTFADLMVLPIELLTRDEQARALVRGDFSHVLVDEFQDNNQGQIELLALLCGAAHGEARSGPAICVVGDDDQAIYGFRGSDELAFERFGRYWPTHEVIELTENFRSTPMVVGVANRVIQRAFSRFRPQKLAQPMRQDDGRVLELVATGDDIDYGSPIASLLRIAQAEARVRATGDHVWDWGAHAVLVRTHTDAERVASTLTLEGIPWVRSRQRTDLDEAGVEDVLAWAAWLLDGDATVHARRALTRPPVLVDVGELASQERAYLSQLHRHGLDPDGVGHPGRYTSFLATAKLLDEVQRGALMRGLETYATLRDRVLTLEAGEALDLIVRTLDVTHAELLGGIERARRVRALVTLLKLARDKREMLDEPGDLRAFLRYLEELRRADPKLESVSRSDVDDAATGDDPQEIVEAGGRDADGVGGGGARERGRVHILTAHASKGLEFDNVYVARVTTPNGFPKTKSNPREDRWVCPPELTGMPSPLDGERALLDEERRLFYVACTRARTRLVWLARHSGKASSSAMHFFDEFALDKPEGIAMSLERGEAIQLRAAKMGLVAVGMVRADASGGVGERIEDVTRHFAHRQAVDEVVAQAQQYARLQAARALEVAAAGQVGSPEEFDKIVASMASAARHAGALASASQGVSPAAWLMEEDPQRRALVARVLEAREREGKAAKGELRLAVPATPLRLSYTQVDAFERCPRCWYARFVLGLPEASSRESVVGGATHAALERFYRTWMLSDAEGKRKPGLGELLRLGRDMLVEQAKGLSAGAIDAIEEQHAQVQAQLERYWDVLHDPRAHILELERAIDFVLEVDGASHQIQAKLDRLEQASDGGFRVVDYKTGQAWNKHLEPAKDDLQLGIYSLALAASEGVEVAQLVGGAEYWVLHEGACGRLAFADVKVPKVLDRLRKVVRGMVGGVYGRGDRCSGMCAIL